jgi:hypothetical protein
LSLQAAELAAAKVRLALVEAVVVQAVTKLLQVFLFL